MGFFYDFIMERFKTVKKTVYLIWDEVKQGYWFNGPEWLSFEARIDAEKWVKQMNQLQTNLGKPQPYQGIGRPRKADKYTPHRY